MRPTLRSFAVLTFGFMMTGTDVSAQSAASDANCSTYLRNLADAALAIGRADGHVQVYDALLPKSDGTEFAFPGTETWITRERDAARREVQVVTAAAEALGEPPARCAFDRSVVVQPGILVGLDEGIYLAYMTYADFVGHSRAVEKDRGGISRDGSAAASQYRQLAEKNYPQKATAAKRAAFEALLVKIRRGFGRG